MPITGKRTFEFPRGPGGLYALGVSRIQLFCKTNRVPPPSVTSVSRGDWYVGACAFYRPDTPAEAKYRLPRHGGGINVCLPLCQRPCDDEPGRNWSWPGSKVDRTPYGVLCHELGHHCDWSTGERKGRYYSEYCEEVKDRAGEPGLTSYADENPAEYLAEAFRLFVTNPGLLRCLRPKTFAVLSEKWTPVGTPSWKQALGANCPVRVLKTLEKQGAK